MAVPDVTAGRAGLPASVTCVIPTHGRPDDLQSSIASVLAQTRAPDVLVVVDDLADPATRDVVEAASARSLVEVRLLHNPQGTGASSSRNAGARAATTDYVAFLDDDDVWRPEFLEHTVACLQRTGADLALSGVERFRADGGRQRIVAPVDVTLEQLMSKNPGVTGTNVVINRSAFLATGGFDEGLRVYNDWDFFITCFRAGLRYSVVPECLVEWREHAGERLSTMSLRRAEGIEAFTAKHRSLLNERQQRELAAVAQGIRRRRSPTRLGRACATWRLAQARRWRVPARRRAVGLLDPDVLGHVVFPHSRDGLGGSVITGGLLARDLQATGRWRTDVVVNGEGPVAAYHRRLGVATFLLDQLGRSAHRPRPEDGNALRRLHKRAQIAVRAEKYLQRHAVDLVHVNDESSALGWGLAAKRRGIPMLWHVHQQRARRLDPLLLRLSDHVLFVADANRVRFGTSLRTPSTTVYNTVDTDVFTPAPQRSERTTVRLAFVSNLVARKRPEWAVLVGAQLLEEGFDVEVLVVGADFSGRAVEELTASPAGARLGRRLTCAGRSDDVPGVLQQVDVLLLPSMRDREAFPRIVVEAMSCAVPVVATAVAGIPEAVEDGATGLLVDPDDYEAFAGAVRTLVLDRGLRERFGAAARARAVATFSASSTLALVEQVYAGLLDGAATGRDAATDAATSA